MWVCFLGFVILFWQHLHNSILDAVGGVTLSQPAGGKDPMKNKPKTIKTQEHPENQHKWHKRHQKSIKFRRSRRLHHLIAQVSYHRSSHHSQKVKTDQFKKQKQARRALQIMGRQRNNPQSKGKEES